MLLSYALASCLVISVRVLYSWSGLVDPRRRGRTSVDACIQPGLCDENNDADVYCTLRSGYPCSLLLFARISVG